MTSLKQLCLAVTLFFALFFGASSAFAQDAKAIATKAREEGKVVFYTTMALPDAQTLTALFEKQQPGVNVEMFRSGSGDITNRVQTEDNASGYLVDVIQGVANRAMIPAFKERGIIDKHISPQLKFVPDDLKDKEGYWASPDISPFGAGRLGGISSLESLERLGIFRSC